jgi:eukaryotic-like serine/threonine-protein kinase
MDADRFRLIESLYHSALVLDGTAREAFLEKACAGDEELRHELLRLLTSAESTDSFLEEPAVSLGLSVINLGHETLVGKTIGHYQLTELLGSGGMGDVYLAHDPRLQRPVALKLLRKDLTGEVSRVRRFKQEARAASAIPHPNVAHIYEIGEAEGQHYIAMEYVPGRTLRRELEGGAPGVGRALDIALQVSAALGAAHRAGVIHRDIKPENIMLLEEGYVKVLDFGLAKLAEHKARGPLYEAPAASSLHTEPDLLMGTSYYMSPEQVRRRPVDARTDLWSLGVVCYEMLSGGRPFGGGSLGEVIVAILEQEPEPLGGVREDLPPRLQQVVAKALRKDPEERYQTAEEISEDLRQVARQTDADFPAAPAQPAASSGPTEPPPRAPAAPRGHVTAGLERPDSTHTRQTTLRERAEHNAVARRGRMSVWALAGLLALTLAAGVGLYWRLSGERRGALSMRDYKPQFERLNLSGDITDIVISPDGHYVASIILEEGKKAIHIMEVATSSDLRIVPPSGKDYSALSFSPDGNYLYFLENQTETGTLYRISKLGGGLRKILTNVNTPVTFSSDGTHMGFIRYNFSANTSDLIIAREDGTEERRLTGRTVADEDVFPADMRGIGPAWGPDNNILICPTRSQKKRNPAEMNLDVIEVVSGRSHRLNAKPWHDISRITWLADGSGLLIAATESPDAPLQLILVSCPGGEVRYLTNDPNNYNRVSGTSDSRVFLTLNVEESSSIWRISRNTATPPVPLNVSHKRGVLEVIFRPDGKILYTADDGKNVNLWTRDADSESVNQITFEASKKFRPAISPDQRYIVFVSSSAGATNIWRIDADGTQLKQLTSGSYEDMPSVSPDGRWVIYRGGGSVSKIPIDGGTPVKLLSFPGKSMLFPALSPDGTMVAFFINEGHAGQNWKLEVYNLDTLKQVKAFDLPETARPFSGVRWTRDNKGLTYVNTSSGASNLWIQSLDGGEPKWLTDFKDADLISFDWSADGEQIICVRTVQTHIPVLVRLF